MLLTISMPFPFTNVSTFTTWVLLSVVMYFLRYILWSWWMPSLLCWKVPSSVSMAPLQGKRKLLPGTESYFRARHCCEASCLVCWCLVLVLFLPWLYLGVLSLGPQLKYCLKLFSHIQGCFYYLWRIQIFLCLLRSHLKYLFLDLSIFSVFPHVSIILITQLDWKQKENLESSWLFSNWQLHYGRVIVLDSRVIHGISV